MFCETKTQNVRQMILGSCISKCTRSSGLDKDFLILKAFFLLSCFLIMFFSYWVMSMSPILWLFSVLFL